MQNIWASMSIRVFFESYFINDLPCKQEKIKKWMDRFGEPYPPSTARFVDGAFCLIFQLIFFYNPKVLIPGHLSISIYLDDTVPDNQSKHADSWSLMGYCG